MTPKKAAVPAGSSPLVTIRYCAKVARIVHNLPNPGDARRFKPGETVQVGETMAAILTARLVFGEKQWERVAGEKGE